MNDATLDPQKQAWKNGAAGLDANVPLSTLEEANAAPDASESERKGMGMMMKLALGLTLSFVVVMAISVHFVKKYDAHEARISSIKDQPSGLPAVDHIIPLEQSKPAKPSAKPSVKVPKIATDNIATQAIDMPAIPSFEAIKALARKPRIKDDFTTEFDRDLSKFETDLKKEYP